jgi:myo-inositol-1(or 4)-monophosphatase
LALVEDGMTTFAAVYDPSLNELFVARAGVGATVNGNRIAVSAKTGLATAVVGTAVAPIARGDTPEFQAGLASLAGVTREVFVVRQMASASLQLAYVAAGRLDAYWELGDDVNDWLAGALLVEAAGGLVRSLDGSNFDGRNGILAGPSPLIRSLGQVVVGDNFAGEIP